MCDVKIETCHDGDGDGEGDSEDDVRIDGEERGRVCRVCLCSMECSLLKPMLQHHHQYTHLTLKDMYLYVTRIQMLDVEGLPNEICSSCMDKVKMAYELIIRCEKSEAMLKKSIDHLYQRFRNVQYDASIHENETILVVMPKSEILDDDDGFLEESSLNVGDDLFVFTLGKNGNMRDFNTLKLDSEILKIKDEYDESMHVSTVKAESESDQDEFINNLKSEIKESDEESSQNSRSSHVNDLEESSIFPIDESQLDLSNIELISSDIYYDELHNSNNPNDARLFCGTLKNMTGFRCTMCNKIFATKGELKFHLNEHPKGTKHVCRICFKSYSKISILKSHYMSHKEDKKKNYCSHCSQSFSSENSLVTHICSRLDLKHNCSICFSEFATENKLIEHFNSAHSMRAEYEEKNSVKNHIDNFDCTMCLASFDNLDMLKDHKKVHPEGTRHVCRICNKSYLEVSTLKRHMIVHTGKKGYLCPVCGKSFFYRNVLKSHMVYHSEKKHKCHLCDKRFHMRHMLQEHIRMSHSNNRYNYMCDTCGKLCSSGRRFAIHKESHTTISCPTCGKLYRNVRYYKQHLKTHNGVRIPKKTFICDYCGEERSLKTLLELHILSKHLNERRYQCKLCDKAFFSKGSLSEHEVVHNRKKSEKCNICGRILVNRKALILHNRLHTGEKPYPCHLCNEKFLSSSRRLAHVKSKHGERTEHCTLCPSKFFLRSDLNKHMIVHSKERKKAKKDFPFNMS